MRFPKFTAEQGISLNNKNMNRYLFGTTPQTQTNGIHRIIPAVDFDCISGCVGSTAYDCIHCNDDINCWQECAGHLPSTIGCIENCF